MEKYHISRNLLNPLRMFSSRLSGRSAVAESADRAEQRRQTLP